jgi:hypothetical protein
MKVSQQLVFVICPRATGWQWTHHEKLPQKQSAKPISLDAATIY